MTGQSETKHTPGELYAAEDFNGRPVVKGDGSVSIAACYHPPVGDGKANAARIALTWNCHDELVAACQAVVDACTSAPPMDLIKRLGECADKCAAALAKASA